MLALAISTALFGAGCVGATEGDEPTSTAAAEARAGVGDEPVGEVEQRCGWDGGGCCWHHHHHCGGGCGCGDGCGDGGCGCGDGCGGNGYSYGGNGYGYGGNGYGYGGWNGWRR